MVVVGHDVALGFPRRPPVGNYGVSEVERRSETRSLYVCALCLAASFESLLDRREAHDRLVFKSEVLCR
jgi:hypothetical protein